MSNVIEELKAREPIFHRPELGTDRADFESMIADGFWEIGASGRCYSREFVLDELERRSQNPIEDVWETKDFLCRELAPDVFLLNYTLIQNKIRTTRRSTLWWRTEVGWKILFHQGTIVQDE
ncbi:MAG TPA: DUF4440 domain-containing protein [Edaphobacter sp.]|jgi:hypothetical protein|nr:DUF4440 domain-containing protein [Edaphobacter sp.]